MVRLTMVVVLLAGCSVNPEKALSLLQSQGLSDIQILPSKPMSWSDCYRGTGLAFRASDKKLEPGAYGEGRLVVGMVCCAMGDCEVKQDPLAIRSERKNLAAQAAMKAAPSPEAGQQAAQEH